MTSGTPEPRGITPETGASGTTDQRRRQSLRRLRRRHAAERRFRLAGQAAALGSLTVLALLLLAIAWRGVPGFVAVRVALPLDLAAAPLAVAPAQMEGRGAALALAGAGLPQRIDRAAVIAFGTDGPDLIADRASQVVAARIAADPALLHRRSVFLVPAASPIAIAAKHGGDPQTEAAVRRLRAAGALSYGPDLHFLTASDASEPADAGIFGAVGGSLLTMVVTLIIAVPIGVFAALYLEEHAPRDRLSDVIEVSINNLAAVPSIVFGLLGLAVFIGTLGLPRSAPLVAGMTLALMTMPVIFVTARGAIRSVPASVREAARGIGASPIRVVFDHVLPLALPGILTGTIIGVARALGETAPLLLIGMRAFVAAAPTGLRQPATALPVQIFLWSEEVNRGFLEKSAAAILVLLALLLLLNGAAIHLRHRFETRL